jgi:carbonic anhydrase
MTESSLLRQIGEANKSYLAGTPRFLDAGGDPFVVVACIDPRLTGFLEPALGLPRHRAIIIRTAGNQLSERTRDELRSIAVALYVKNAREIVVVGHTDCGMSTFSAADVAEAFRKAGIPRNAFGDEDLRSWFGAFASIRDNVLGSVAFLRRSGIVPREVRIHGLVLETDKGTIEIVADADLVKEVAAPPVALPESSGVAAGPQENKTTVAAPPPAPAPSESVPKKGPIIVGQPAAKAEPVVAPPASLLEAALVMRDFIHRERQGQQVRKSIEDIKALWKQDKNPYGVFAELQKIGRAYEAKYPKLPGALAYLENAIRSGHANKIGFGEVMKRILD